MSAWAGAAPAGELPTVAGPGRCHHLRPARLMPSSAGFTVAPKPDAKLVDALMLPTLVRRLTADLANRQLSPEAAEIRHHRLKRRVGGEFGIIG